MRKKRVETQDVVVSYAKLHMSMAQIAALRGVTRQAVWKRIKAAGVPIRSARIQIDCAFCGSQFEIWRHRLKCGQKHYCSVNCYYASRENPGYRPWRQGCRLARAIVGQYFKLEPGMIVHHKDGNNRNNDRANLAVYASHSAHLRNHHGKLETPLWDGGRS